MDIQKLKKEISEDEKKLSEKKSQLYEAENKNQLIEVSGTDYVVEKDVHHKNKSYNELKEEFGEHFLNEHLITLYLFEKISENKELLKTLKMDGSSSHDDFFIKQPLVNLAELGKVAMVCVGSCYACLNCRVDDDNHDSTLGVRFCFKKSEIKKK
jgi:hypothetical protein